VIRRLVLSTLVVATLGTAAAPALAGDIVRFGDGTTSAGPATPKPPVVPGLTNRYVCVTGDDPDKGFCVWAPLPV
jgi:hypothetical protein